MVTEVGLFRSKSLSQLEMKLICEIRKNAPIKRTATPRLTFVVGSFSTSFEDAIISFKEFLNLAVFEGSVLLVFFVVFLAIMGMDRICSKVTLERFVKYPCNKAFSTLECPIFALQTLLHADCTECSERV